MNFKLILLIYFITTFCFICSADVQLSWNPSTDTFATGYKIYWGTTSHSYLTAIDVGKVTNTIINTDSFVLTGVYYFAATTYAPADDGTTNLSESNFSNEVIWTNTPLNITYVGVRVDYGVSLTSISSQQIMVMAVTNEPNYFYSESLIITNNPFIGIGITDGNSYIYLGTTIQYGGSLMTLTNETFPLMTFTNPPAYYYRSSLIITNNPF